MNKMDLFDRNGESSEASSSPIQDENGNLTFNYNGKTYTVNVNSEEDRNSFAEDFNKENGKKFEWFKERLAYSIMCSMIQKCSAVV